MKFLHLGDLHIGKKVNDISMIDEQKHVLNSAVELIKTEKIDCVLISGDVFDKPVPSVNALEVFDEFTLKLTELGVSIYIISGNHDSPDRLCYMSSFLKKSNIFISKPYEGEIESYKVQNNIRIWLMPYLYPAMIRKYHKNEKIESYNDAFGVLIKNLKINKDEINILLAHQFVIGVDAPVLSESEQKSVGGVDNISYELFSDFDYVALGHLHCPQKTGRDNIRYAGSILKYSFSEINQKKRFTILDVKNKNDIKISFKDISPIHELKEYRGFLDEFLDEKFYKNIDTNDYIHFTLTDEAVMDAKKKLLAVYPNIMLLDFDNEFTRNLTEFNFANNLKDKTVAQHFSDFYEMQYGQKPDPEKEKIIADELNELLREVV